uniref:Uncharacterized protein n=1 Tax=Mucochytrium quahogii TaxID=96639 RepID=A0A7S2S3J2_9STRA|mmetsp:Transcript_4891/g.7398  ORF Transcript_4891/g.7398 Transcript_4891/m.7398 type:complete len:310 (+) Transcript_4891:201-1130(+)
MCIRFALRKIQERRDQRDSAASERETSNMDAANNNGQAEYTDGGPGLIGTILPFVYFPMDTSESRHAYMENLFSGKTGKILSFLPFILVMIIACNNITAAVWSAFGTESILILASIYRSRYNKFVPAVMFLDGGLFLGFLAQGISVLVLDARDVDYNCHLISPINASVLFVVTLLSMIVCIPFTMQYARAHVSAEVSKSSGFLKFNQILTGLWLVLFAIMSISTWCGYVYFRDQTNSAGYIILATVVPIAMPISGAILMPMLIEYLKKKAPQSGQEEGDSTEANGNTESPDLEAQDNGYIKNGASLATE